MANLPVWDNVLLLLLAGVVATLTYYLFENPIRHSRLLARRKWASLLMGLCLIVATLAVTTYEQRRPTVILGSFGIGGGRLPPAPGRRVEPAIEDISLDIPSETMAIRTCSRSSSSGLDVVHAAPGPRRRRTDLRHAIRERRRDRMRCGQWRDRPARLIEWC